MSAPAAAMLDQEVGLLSARKTPETRVVPRLVGQIKLTEGEHSWGGALMKVAVALVSAKVVKKNEWAGGVEVEAMILAILSQTVHQH